MCWSLASGPDAGKRRASKGMTPTVPVRIPPFAVPRKRCWSGQFRPGMLCNCSPKLCSLVPAIPPRRRHSRGGTQGVNRGGCISRALEALVRIFTCCASSYLAQPGSRHFASHDQMQGATVSLDGKMAAWSVFVSWSRSNRAGSRTMYPTVASTMAATERPVVPLQSKNLPTFYRKKSRPVSISYPNLLGQT